MCFVFLTETNEWYKFKLQFCVEVFHKILQMPPNYSGQFVCPSPKVWNFQKSCFWVSAVVTLVQEMFLIMISNMKPEKGPKHRYVMAPNPNHVLWIIFIGPRHIFWLGRVLVTQKIFDAAILTHGLMSLDGNWLTMGIWRISIFP